ncbi:MAG: YbaB/EbfC family nucleoid-associated protein [Clostridium perfringens]|nr:YbaB/EbfC family nucleoid-associated protein [Clostridium perfringens]
MAKGGFPGMGNMNNLMKQAQMLQKQMAEMQEEIANTEFEGSANGDLVVAKVNGKKELLSLKIKQEIVDPDDVEMLEDLVITAVRMALAKAEEETTSKMGKLTGGMNMPGLF